MRMRVVHRDGDRDGDRASGALGAESAGWPFDEPVACVVDDVGGTPVALPAGRPTISIPLGGTAVVAVAGADFRFGGSVALVSDGGVACVARNSGAGTARIATLVFSPDLAAAAAERAGVVPTSTFLPAWLRARGLHAAVRDVVDMALRAPLRSIGDYGLCERIAVDVHVARSSRWSYIAMCGGQTLEEKVDRLRRLEWTVCAMDAGAFPSIDLEYLARVARMSRCHFARVFAQIYGETAYGYLTRRRCDYAIELMQNTSMPVAAIAHELGFKDRNGFGVFMRARMGCSPRRFRQRVQRAGALRRRATAAPDPGLLLVDA